MRKSRLTPEDARAKLAEATQQVDFVNLGRVISALGEYEYAWNKYDGSKFKPNYERAWRDRIWLAKNAAEIKEAMEVLKKTK